MTSLAKAGGAFVACMVAMSAAAGAGDALLPELRLSDADLDRITGARLLQTEGPFTATLDGPLQPPAPPPPPPPLTPPPPTPPAPNPNAITISEGGTTFTILVPTAPEGSTATLNAVITSNPNGSSGSASVLVISEGRGTVSSGGIIGVSSTGG